MWLGSDPSVAILISLDQNGVLRSIQADGHAGTTAAGANIVCAAITILLRSVFESWARYPGITLEGRAPAAGSLGFSLKSFDPAQACALRAVTEVLLTGLGSLQREYPSVLTLHIETKGGSDAT